MRFETYEDCLVYAHKNVVELMTDGVVGGKMAIEEIDSLFTKTRSPLKAVALHKEREQTMRYRLCANATLEFITPPEGMRPDEMKAFLERRLDYVKRDAERIASYARSLLNSIGEESFSATCEGLEEYSAALRAKEMAIFWIQYIFRNADRLYLPIQREKELEASEILENAVAA